MIKNLPASFGNTENRFVNTGGGQWVGEGEGGMNGENNIETCILSYIKLIASLLYDPNWGSVTT